MATAIDSRNRPNMKEFMDATGADAATASQLLYGAVGSNVDVRDWSKIMSSSNPVQAAQTATAQMYSLPEDVPIATDERFYDRETGSYNPRAVAIEGAQSVAGSSRLQVLPNGQIYILSQSGLPLTGLSPSNAASFGITQAEIDAAIAAGGSNQENRLSGVGYQPYEGGNLLVDYSGLTAPRFSTPPPATGAGVGASPVAGAGASSAALPSFISPGGAGGTPAATGPVFPSFITPVGGVQRIDRLICPAIIRRLRVCALRRMLGLRRLGRRLTVRMGRLRRISFRSLRLISLA
jgi:hypothetical protein